MSGRFGPGRRLPLDGTQNEMGLATLEVVTTTTTSFYSHGRLANIVGSQGGAAKSRADIVNAGSG